MEKTMNAEQAVQNLGIDLAKVNTKADLWVAVMDSVQQGFNAYAESETPETGRAVYLFDDGSGIYEKRPRDWYPLSADTAAELHKTAEEEHRAAVEIVKKDLEARGLKVEIASQLAEQGLVG
jgi:hypothetical protein